MPHAPSSAAIARLISAAKAGPPYLSFLVYDEEYLPPNDDRYSEQFDTERQTCPVEGRDGPESTLEDESEAEVEAEVDEGYGVAAVGVAAAGAFSDAVCEADTATRFRKFDYEKISDAAAATSTK